VATFTLHASIKAPIEVVFDVLTDHRGHAKMTALRSSTLERQGEPPPNGVGAIRVLSLAGPPIRERVTVFDRPRLFAYEMLSGAPILTHTATVELAPQDGRTELTWRVESIPSIPVPDAVWAAVMRLMIKHLLIGVVKEAERQAAAG
jgi:hypothetical protein